MIRGQILITLSDGQVICYANKFLTKKSGLDEEGKPLTDNAGTKVVLDVNGNPVLDEDGNEVVRDVSTPLFEGFPEYNYYYTGAGNDKYENQTGLGKIKGDFEYLTEQLGVVGNDLLRFPEADENHGDVFELIRASTSTVNGVPSYSKKKVANKEVVSITIKEDCVTFPYGRESGYQLSKESDNFMGFQESKDRKERKMRGLDFDKYKKIDNGFIPNPKLKIEDGNLVIVNVDDFDETITTFKPGIGYEVYGKKNGKQSGLSFIALYK